MNQAVGAKNHPLRALRAIEPEVNRTHVRRMAPPELRQYIVVNW
ncbi:MAG: hypothetical protein ABJA60_04360 [Nitrosospira sp.]